MNTVTRVFEDRPCPLGCVGPDLHVISARDRINERPGLFDVVRCGVCGLMRTNPRPVAASMGEFYPDNYGPYLGTAPSSRTGRRYQSLRRLYRWLFPTRATVLPPLAPGDVLEIGCASGAFLTELRTLGWRCKGLEYSPAAADTARSTGHEVHCGAVEDFPDDGRRFDLVVGWMVLEHLHEPVQALRLLAQRTRPEGMIVLSVPNAGSPDFSLFGSAGYALHVPNHLYHFTPTTLEKVLKAGGWEICRIYHHRTLSNWIGALGNRLEDAGCRRGIYGPLKSYPESFGLGTLVAYPFAMLLAAFGATGRMTVWARRSAVCPE